MFSGERRESNMRRLGAYQENMCFHCGRSLEYIRDDGVFVGDDKANIATIEHFIPKSLGGLSRLENLVVAHRKCNNDRKSILPTHEEKQKLERLNQHRREILEEVRQDIAEFGLETPGVLHLSGVLDRLFAEDPKTRERVRRLIASRLTRLREEISAIKIVSDTAIRTRAAELFWASCRNYVERHLGKITHMHTRDILFAYTSVEKAMVREATKKWQKGIPAHPWKIDD